MQKMSNSIKFLKIDISFLLLFLVAYFLEEINLYFYYVIFLCIHEWVHYFVAKKLGYRAKHIHLTFFGASLEGCDDFLSEDEIKIVLAGPLFNLCVIIFCYLSFWFYPESYTHLYNILMANVGIFLFNILPVYPLDMGRVLLAFFTSKLNRLKALEIVKKISFGVLLLMYFVFILSLFYNYNFTFGFVCINLTRLLFAYSKDTSYKRQLFAERKFKLLKKGLVEKNIYVSCNQNIYSLFKFIDDYHFVNFVFLDNQYNKTKTLTEVELYRQAGLLEKIDLIE